MALTPYTGNPDGPSGTGFQDVIALPDSSDNWDAAEFNPAYQQLMDDAAFLNSRLASLGITSWQPSFVWPSGGVASANPYGPTAIHWNDCPPVIGTYGPSAQSWLVAGWYESGPTVSGGVYILPGDGSIGMAEVGGSGLTTGFPITGLATDSAGNIYAAWEGGSDGILVVACAPNSTWGTPVVSALATPSDAKASAFGATVALAAGSTTSGSGWLGNFTSGAINKTRTGLVAFEWVLRNNGSQFVAIVVGGTAGQIYSSPDAVTWTFTALTPSTTVPQDVRWNAKLGLWGLWAITSGGAYVFYTSPDGATWTLIQTLNNFLAVLHGVAAKGVPCLGVANGAWIVAQMDANYVAHITYSFDGVSWYQGPATMTGQTVPSSYLIMGQSPSQLAIIQTSNQGLAQGTVQLGSIFGRPDVALT
jgi:hypothetical protein